MALTQTRARLPFLNCQSDADKALMIRIDAIVSVAEQPAGAHGQARTAIALRTGRVHIVRHSVDEVMRAIVEMDG